jgi:nucleotide-binding universal stress UspA family protein
MSHAVTAGLDGTPESLAAADWAAAEAASRSAPLRLVRVGASAQEAAEAARRCEGLDVTIGHLAGRPAHILGALSTDSAVLVVGSRGLGSVLGLMKGAVALPAVARTLCPVVLVRAEAEGPPDQGADGERAGAVDAVTRVRPRSGAPVVLGVDSYHPSRDVLAFAFAAAARHGAPLRVRHAWEPPAAGLALTPAAPEAVTELMREKDHALAEALRPWREEFPGVAVDSRAVMASPADLLTGAAAGASLVVVGRRRSRRRSRFGPRIGPTAHAVMHHAHAPVAVVPYG